MPVANAAESRLTTHTLRDVCHGKKEGMEDNTEEEEEEELKVSPERVSSMAISLEDMVSYQFIE